MDVPVRDWGRIFSVTRLPKRVLAVYRADGARAVLRAALRFAPRLLIGQLYAILLARSIGELIECPGTVIAGCLYKSRLRLRASRLPRQLWHPVLKIRHTFIDSRGDSQEAETLCLPHRQQPVNGSLTIAAVFDTPAAAGRYTLEIGPAIDAPVSFSSALRRAIHVVPHSDAVMASVMPALDVTMDVTSRCPLRCVQCRKTYTETPADQHDMRPDLFEKIAREVFPFARTLMLSSAGEPLMAKFFWQALERALQHDIQEVAFSSNGLLLDRRAAERVVDMGVGRVELSVDGATRHTYERIRIGSNFDRVIENIRYLSKYKKKKRTRLPIVRVNIVLMRSNIDELPALIELAAGIGAEEVLCQHMIVYADAVRDESLFADKQRSNDRVRAAAGVAARRHVRFFHPRPFTVTEEDVHPDHQPSSRPRFNADPAIYSGESEYGFERKVHEAGRAERPRCADPWRKVAFDWQGGVFPCCSWRGAPIADMNTEPFEAIWNSDDYRTLRRALTAGPISTACLACTAINGGDVDNQSAFLFSSPSA